MKNKTWTTIICTIVIVAVMAYLFHDVIKTNYVAYDTETVNEITQQETVPLKAFIVRDEIYIDGSSNGTVVPLVADGNRVARGDAVARICNSEEDAANYSKLLEAEESLERYQKLNGQTELNALDMEKLNDGINRCFIDLLQTVNSGNYSELSDYIVSYEDKLASKQILSEGSIDLTEKFNALNTEIGSLKSKRIKTKDVEAPLSGYYISNLDGYENTVKYNEVNSLTVDDAEALFSSQPANFSGEMGKIVGSYRWYLVTVIDTKKTLSFSVGDTLKINMPYYGFEGISVKVENISSAKDGKAAVILSCNMMNETYANMRIEDIELVLNEYVGYKIPSDAIREEKNSKKESVKVVYILRGEIMNVRKIEIIYDAGDYVVVSMKTEPGEGYNPVKRYDEVIVKGRNLENGKSVN